MPERVTQREGVPGASDKAYRRPVRFAVLGPLEVTGEDGPLPLGGPKQRILLAHLVLNANQVVSTERLIDSLWGEELPEDPRSTVRVYVSRIRSLGLSSIEARAPGYLLQTERDEVDALRFEDLLAAARSNGHQAQTTDQILGEALALWRGPAFADIAGEPSLAGDIARLEELRLQAIEERVAAELELGHHARVVAELETLTRTQPLRERFWRELMLALYRCDRQAEALAAFDRARSILAEELGIDPSADLRLLHERILRQDPDLELEGEALRGYRLLERIGEGAFGVVYRATQPQIGREVAIKAVPPELANHPDFVRRFEREAQIVAGLEHPHIVPLYDFWREPDAAYLVMRFLRGGSLRDLLTEGPLEPERAASILDQVAAALSAAHRQGVVHRDVKPGNVLLDEEGNAYLADFGVALDAGGSPERPAMRGTPAYLSPEQVRLDPTSPQTDVYALGIVTYEMVTGRDPFPGRSPQQLLDQPRRDPIPSVREARPDLPPAIDHVVAKSTARDTRERFTDALELAAAFRAAIEGTSAAFRPFGEVRNPYKGLRAFLEADAADFFGREELTNRTLRRLEEGGEGSRFLAVVGPSGSGKSSAVRAGLVPALRRGGLEGSERWFIADLVPGPHPLRELESALLALAIEPPPSLLDMLEGETLGLLRAAERSLPDPDAELVIVLDQLEEIFTLVADQDERLHILESIRAAVAAPESRVRVITTLRADFFDQPLLIRGFGDLLAERTEAITPLSPEELERAIVAPAERAGLIVEPRLLAAMIADVVDRPGSLPLLQYALTELVERRDDNLLTLASYRRIGGVSGALARRAEQIVGAMDGGASETCRQLFLRLVTLGDGSEDTRRRVRRSELVPLADPRVMDGVLEAFGRHRLLSFDRDPVSREPTVEIAHEALLGAWGRLRDWIDEAREDIRAQRRLGAAAAEWEANGRDAGFLLSGARLDQADAWAETTTMAVSEADRTYLDESLAVQRLAAERERGLERRSIRRMRSLVAVGLTAAVIATTLTLVAVDQRGRAEDEARTSRARELAATAVAQLDVDTERGLLLAIEAVEMTHAVDGTVLREAEEALHRAVGASRLEVSLPGLGGGIDWSPTGVYVSRPRLGTKVPRMGTIELRDAETGEVVLVFQGHERALTGAAFSPDGSALATTGREGMLKVWDPSTGHLLASVSGPRWASGPSFSGDGSLVAAWWESRTANTTTIRVLDRSNGRVRTFQTPLGVDGQYPALSPDGSRIAIATDDEPGIMKVIDLESRQITTFAGHAELGIQDIAWSPDGRYVAGGQFGSSVKVWDAETGKLRFSLGGHTDATFWVDWSPDSRRLVTGSSDQTTRVWDIADDGARELMTLAAGDGPVAGVAFSPDGTRVMTSSEAGVVKVWDVGPTGEAEWAILPGTSGDVVWPEDGLVASEVDGALSRWRPGASVQEMAPIPSGGPLEGTVNNALSPDGATNAIFHSDAKWYESNGTGTVRVVDTATSEELFALEDVLIGERIGVVDWSPNGEHLAAASRSGLVTVYDRSGNEVGVLPDAGTDVLNIEFSPDGSLVAVLLGEPWYISADGVQHDSPPIRVWDWRRGDVAVIPVGGYAEEIAFDPKGTRIVTDLLEIRDIRSGRLVVELPSPPADPESLAFSPDGSLLAVGSMDDTIRMFDAESGEERLLLQGHQGTVHRLVFSPDGSTIASMSGDDDMVRVWALDIGDLLEIARREVTRSLTEAECRQFMHVDACPTY